MRRFTALINKIVPFPLDVRNEFFKIVKAIDLMPGEWVPDDLPTGTSIFVEDGLLLLTRCENKQWQCSNFYIEGTLTVTCSEGAPEMNDGSFRVRAATCSRIYYMTREDACEVQKIFPSYSIARHVLSQRSFFKSQVRKVLFDLPPAGRILYVDDFFRTLLRAPTEDLAEFLDLKTKKQRQLLAALQKQRLSPQQQLS